MELQTDLPTGNNGFSMESPTENTSKFKQVLKESKASVGQPFVTPPTEKRKPGRPRKPKSEDTAQTGNAGPSPSVVQAPPPDISQYLIEPIQGLSKIPAAKYGVPDMAFTADEAMACAKSLDQVVSVLFPDLNNVDPRLAAVLSASMTIGSICYSKYGIYLSKKEELNKLNNSDENSPASGENAFPTEKVPAPPVPQNGPSVDSNDYFIRKSPFL